jgi:hypothetical protein
MGYFDVCVMGDGDLTGTLGIGAIGPMAHWGCDAGIQKNGSILVCSLNRGRDRQIIVTNVK